MLPRIRHAIPITAKSIAVAVAVGFFGALPINAAAKCPPCMDGRMVALQEGEFTGYLMCDGPHSSFRLVGKLVSGSGTYVIYDYNYEYHAAVIWHTQQRLIVFESRGRYLGQYNLPHDEDNVHLRIAGASVNWRSGKQKGLIDFGDGPPPRILVLGEFDEFFK